MALFSVSSHPEVDKLVETCGYAAAALTILPIPGSEILGVMPLHVGMVIGIANHYDRTITRETATNLILQIGATVGLSLVGSRLATTAAKFVLPGLGGIIAAPFMYASTLAIGAVADGFFRTEGKLTEEQMRNLYNETLKGAKSSFRPEKMREKSAMDHATSAVADADAPPPEAASGIARLRKAKEMLAEGLIDQAEFDALKERILSEV
jgi:uncharacterized protein (DUF697 family)